MVKSIQRNDRDDRCNMLIRSALKYQPGFKDYCFKKLKLIKLKATNEKTKACKYLIKYNKTAKKYFDSFIENLSVDSGKFTKIIGKFIKDVPMLKKLQKYTKKTMKNIKRKIRVYLRNESPKRIPQSPDLQSTLPDSQITFSNEGREQQSCKASIETPPQSISNGEMQQIKSFEEIRKYQASIEVLQQPFFNEEMQQSAIFEEVIKQQASKASIEEPPQNIKKEEIQQEYPNFRINQNNLDETEDFHEDSDVDFDEDSDEDSDEDFDEDSHQDSHQDPDEDFDEDSHEDFDEALYLFLSPER